jgi:hypothetical protein
LRDQFQEIRRRDRLDSPCFRSPEIPEIVRDNVAAGRRDRQFKNELIIKEEAKEFARGTARDARFRIQVVSAYLFTCALTGYRLTTLSGSSIVDAAHIHERRDCKNDDPRNGLALSKNAHWMFDEGLWTFTDDLKILIAEKASAVLLAWKNWLAESEKIFKIRCSAFMSESWSRHEVEAAVADYFDMLAKELAGLPFNKAEHNRNLQRLLPQRSKGSIERKHQNLSAILIELGWPYVDGYKPLRNYQELLREVVEERLTGAVALHQSAERAVERPLETSPAVPDILSILVPPPVREDQPIQFRDTPKPSSRPVRRNYLEAEARNHSLGRAGEEFVLKFEHERLWRAGKRTLADRIEHVSSTQGDHLGFDILSFEENGRERLIEVKTTRFGALTPFFATRNEVALSEHRDPEYQLYRLFKFANHPRLFVLPGSLRDSCTLEPKQFSALPK